MNADLFSGRRVVDIHSRESMILGISPLFEKDTPKTLLDVTPLSSPIVDPSVRIIDGTDDG